MPLTRHLGSKPGKNHKSLFGFVGLGEESTLHHARKLQDATDGQPVFQPFARQHSPPVAAYPIVQNGLELLEVLVSSPQTSANRRFARVSADTQYIQVEGNFNVPANTNATVDCQGSVLSFQTSAEPTSAATGSVLDMYSCNILGFPESSEWAEKMALWDVALIYPCQAKNGSRTALQQELMDAGPAGVHYENRGPVGLCDGRCSYRNVTLRCSSTEAIERETLALIRGSSSISIPTGSQNEPAWILIVIISCVALFALLCVCGAVLVRRKRSDRVPVEICSHSRDDESYTKVTWSMMRPVEASGSGITGIPEAGNTALHGDTRVAAQHVDFLRRVHHSAGGSSGAPVRHEHWFGAGHPREAVTKLGAHTITTTGREPQESSWICTAPAVPNGTNHFTASKPPSNYLPHRHSPASMPSRHSFNQFSTTAPSHREGYPGWNSHQQGRRACGGTSYHDVVKFTGASRSHKASCLQTDGTDFHNDLYGSLGAGELASIPRLDITATSHASHGDDTRMGSVCSPRSLAASLLTTTRSVHIPSEHMALLQELPMRGPDVWRASWKDVASVVQDLTFAINNADEGNYAADSASVFAGAVIANNLSHSHVISTFVHEVTHEISNDRCYCKLRLVQELCLGGTLAELMHSGGLGTQQGGLHIHRVLTILRHIASGLVHLHRLSLTFGDLDPSQVLLCIPEASSEQHAAAVGPAPWAAESASAASQLLSRKCTVKLANFGWSHAQCDTCTRVVPAGWQPTRAYWSPERAAGVCGMPEAHVYSFGCIMWEMYVTHEALIESGSGPNPQLGMFPGSTPMGYVLLAISCLSPDPADRPTMEQVVQVLADLTAEISTRYYTDLCGATQIVDRMAYKLDRKTLMDPDLVMSSHQDLSFFRIPPPISKNSKGLSCNSLTNDLYRPGSEAGLTTVDTNESPRIPLPESVTAILHQYLSGRLPELG